MPLWWRRKPSVAFEKLGSLSTDYKAPFIGNVCRYIKWIGSFSRSFIPSFSLSLPFLPRPGAKNAGEAVSQRSA